MARALLDAHDGDIAKATIDWQKIRDDSDAQVPRDIEAARVWEPKVTVRSLSPSEHQKLDRLLEGRLLTKPTVGAVRRRREDAAKGPAYVLAALEGEAHAVATAPVGLRNTTLNSSAWTLARLVNQGLVNEDGMERVLVAAAHDAGLTEQEARSTIRGALRRRSHRP
jgi:hypothetical protein